MFNIHDEKTKRFNYDSFLEILFFTSSVCGPCPKMEERLLEAIERKMLPIKVIRIDVLKTPEAAEKYDIVACPTVIFPDFLRVSGSYETEIVEELVSTYFASAFEFPTVEEFAIAHK